MLGNCFLVTVLVMDRFSPDHKLCLVIWVVVLCGFGFTGGGCQGALDQKGSPAGADGTDVIIWWSSPALMPAGERVARGRRAGFAALTVMAQLTWWSLKLSQPI